MDTWSRKITTLNTLCNSFYSTQEAPEIQPCIPGSCCILQGQPISRSSRSGLYIFRQQTSPCQMSPHESTLLLTISHPQSLDTLRGDWLCLGLPLGGDWRKEGHPLVVVWLYNYMVRKNKKESSPSKFNGLPAIPFFAHSERSSSVVEALWWWDSWGRFGMLMNAIVG